MKKSVIIGACGILMLTSCGSSAGSGAMNGAMLGGWFGSAIGGIFGGHYGHDVGTVIGMATGAAIGAANGARAEARDVERLEEYHERMRERGNERYGYDDSGFDATNSGDDRIDFESSITDTNSTVFQLKNIRFTDANGDGILQRSEIGKVSFEIKNVTSQMQYDLAPSIAEASGNKHILISPNARIENIAPGQTLRYTAMVKADDGLKDGQISFEASVALNGKTQGKELTIGVSTSKLRNQQ